jgi:acetyl-CoA carboxylase beta subunit
MLDAYGGRGSEKDIKTFAPAVLQIVANRSTMWMECKYCKKGLFSANLEHELALALEMKTVENEIIV